MCVGLLLLTASAGSNAWGETAQVGKVIVGFHGAISPATLPKKTLVPVALSFDGTIKTADGSHVPPLSTLNLEFNRHGALVTRGIPVCRVRQLKSTVTGEAIQRCGAALVGRGEAGAEIALPAQPPFEASGPLLIFNGGFRNGRPLLIMHVYATLIAPATFVTTAAVLESSGNYGTRIAVKIPRIAAGQGSLISFDATLRRIVRANCPAPAHLPGAVFPLARATLEFEDGSVARSILVRQCKVRK